VPIAINLGIHPLHFALVMLVNLNIGLITPPVGVCIYAASAITGLSLEKISKAAIPFITAEIIALLVMTYVPDFILFLPRILGYI
jgi:TRAP-type C4-dicarboxylate transport system permease large subunit